MMCEGCGEHAAVVIIKDRALCGTCSVEAIPAIRNAPSSPGRGTDAEGNPAPDNIDLRRRVRW